MIFMPKKGIAHTGGYDLQDGYHGKYVSYALRVSFNFNEGNCFAIGYYRLITHFVYCSIMT